MLRHDQVEEMAAKVRVTPTELAAAIAALEARKQGASGTIAIGEAVDELSLDNTPNDILREIDAQRAQGTAKRRRKRRGLLGLAAALVAAGMAGVILRPHTPLPSVSTVAAPQSSPLSDIRDEQQVYVDTHGLKQIIDGTSASQVQVFTSNDGIRWGLIKHGGKTYVQAYTLQATEKTLTTKPITIVNSEDHYGSNGAGFDDYGTLYPTVEVTLPVTAFLYQDSEQTPKHAQITVADVHTDSHLWDGFTDRFAQ